MSINNITWCMKCVQTLKDKCFLIIMAISINHSSIKSKVTEILTTIQKILGASKGKHYWNTI